MSILDADRQNQQCKNGNAVCVQMDAKRDRTTNTREQRAKLSGVSAGTVARYDTVMNSDNKELQQQYLVM